MFRTTFRAASLAAAALLAGGLTASGASAATPAPSESAASRAAPAPSCRPNGLHPTPGVDTPYCLVYDEQGREKMGADHARRVIGYFTSWRHGKDGTPAYLVPDIPWEKVTHINYAFAGVQNNQISIGSDSPDNPSVGMTWPDVPGAEMDPSLPYQGHFNLLSQYNARYPDVKTLISVGGWADSTGFYTMTVNSDGSINHAGIDAFADSVVEFLRTYDFFDGVDIDYEYPTTMPKAGNPDDWDVAQPRKSTLMAGYAELMRTLRERLDQASSADGEYYMLTAAHTASGWILRGMENLRVNEYLDYVNLMTYDLHGAWNEFVGPIAALYDDGQDAELEHWGVYTAPQYGGIGYLNTDWAYHYYRGSMPAGRINIGVPFYTRGWKGVEGGTHGLWGSAVLDDQARCPTGTGTGELPCGDGAVGIDNLWHDLNEAGEEIPSGVNPMWHAKNLQEGIAGSYREAYGLDPANDPDDQLAGDYVRYYDSTLRASWLWNEQEKVFLSTEDEQALAAKAQYVIDQGIGGVMIWELAGDYDWYPDRRSGKGEYFFGDTLVSQLHQAFADAPAYETTMANVSMPDHVLDIDVELVNWPAGPSNYPIHPTVRITNNSGTALPGGTKFEFSYPTSAPSNATVRSPAQMGGIQPGHTGPNVGGLTGDFHRVSFTTASWQDIPPGGTFEFVMTYQLPLSGPSNWTVTLGGNEYGLDFEHRRGTTKANPGDPPGDGDSEDPGDPGACSAPAWDANTAYNGGERVSHGGHTWQAKWWTQGDEPGMTGQWGVWEDLGACGTAGPA